MEFSGSNVNHINLDGLHTCLLRYDDVGKQGACGPWSVHDGGYDLLWELCYDSQPVVGCYNSDGNRILERSSNIPDKTFSEICDIVHSLFPECEMAAREKLKIQQNNQSQGR